MDDSSEQSHWATPALLSSDSLGVFSPETGLLPSVEEGDAFFSNPEVDYAGLSSYFSNPIHSRAPSTYRNSTGQTSTLLYALYLSLAGNGLKSEVSWSRSQFCITEQQQAVRSNLFFSSPQFVSCTRRRPC